MFVKAVIGKAVGKSLRNDALRSRALRNNFLCGSVIAAAMTMASPGVAAPGAALPPLPLIAENVTFWAQPFPYGYRWRNVCVRQVRVVTSRGMRVRRVWVCH